MFDRYETGDHAILVHVNFQDDLNNEDLIELSMLVDSAGVTNVATVVCKRAFPHVKYFIGSGKISEIASLVKEKQANLIIFNHSLTPSQERNIEKLCKCRVLDRTTLILDIFAQRARTFEGKLQVELAQLKHLSTRLIRGWTHLERQKGGIGLRGPGETQLETDRRLLRGRIKNILNRLHKVEKQREQNRKSRKKVDIPTISLVGYTNAGKSTLFNTLTNADVYVADQLFATLDPTLRKIEIEDVGTTILADTVGFIRHLPHNLVAAFKATLQETKDANLLLHVVDCSDEKMHDNITAVNTILEEINADEVKQLIVYNKIDKLADFSPKIEYDENNLPTAVFVSALNNDGINLIYQAISKILAGTILNLSLKLPITTSKLRSELFMLNCIIHEEFDEQGNCLLDIKIDVNKWLKLVKHYRIDNYIT